MGFRQPATSETTTVEATGKTVCSFQSVAFVPDRLAYDPPASSVGL